MDLGGLPVEPIITNVIDSQRSVFQNLGCIVDQKNPDLADANELFLTWRGWQLEINEGEMLANHRDQLKETLVWDIEQGLSLTGQDIGRAEVQRTELFQKMHNFMEKYEFLICPVSQVPPFDVKKRWITEINGVEMENFIAWMKSCYYITATGHPAISVPCGFTNEGLPVGVQIVGRANDDFGVLQLAKAFEEATGLWSKKPEVCD